MTRIRPRGAGQAEMVNQGVMSSTFDPWGCRCKPKSYVLATFRNEQLVSVTRMHNRSNRDGSPQDCHLAPEPLDPRDWDGRR